MTFLLVPPGVYQPRSDTELLIEALRREPMRSGSRVLDLGTGSGAVAVAAARRGASVTAVDVSWRAVATTWVNGVLHRRLIRVRKGDLLTAVRGHSFDLVVSNPPYVPSPHVPLSGIARAWDAGPTGRFWLDRICRRAPRALKPGGVLLLVQSSLADVPETLRSLRRAGLAVETVSRVRREFGPITRPRARWLERNGLLADGERQQELVVIRGVRT
jgi:release factor glutamine methyltransferase